MDKIICLGKQQMVLAEFEQLYKQQVIGLHANYRTMLFHSYIDKSIHYITFVKRLTILGIYVGRVQYINLAQGTCMLHTSYH